MKVPGTVATHFRCCILALAGWFLFSLPTSAQVRFENKGAGTTPPPTTATTTPASGKFKVPSGDDVSAYAKFLTEMLAFQPKSPEEAKEYELHAPLAMVEAAQKIIELEKNTESDNYLMAQKYLLAVDVMSVAEATQEEKKLLMEMVVENLSHPKMDADDIDIAVAMAEGLEMSGDFTNARLAYEQFSKALSKHKDPLVGELGQVMLGSARRLGLVGSTIDVQGTTYEGRPFNWKDYRGKVVLIDFWATWCGPCRAEFPNLKKHYEAYKNRGFEIVAISLDEDRAKLDEFMRDNKFPWTTLHDGGGVSPTATYYGVSTLPTSILVDQKGTVVSINARGEELTKLLEKLLGSATARR